MDCDTALKILGLEVPTTVNAVKTAYRRQSKLEHPDASKHPEASFRFRQVNEAYITLKDDASILDGAIPLGTRTQEGDEITALGKGLGLTVNGICCDECKGDGYKAVFQSEKPCPDCRPVDTGTIFSFFIFQVSPREYRCWKCAGTGFFSKNGKRIGVCFACQGKGWYRRKRSKHDPCKTCRDLGRVKTSDKTFYTCQRCEGKGELPMWNPVLPRGLLANLQDKSQ